MTRRRARALAVEILYAADIRSEDPLELLRERGSSPYSERLISTATRRRDEIDSLLGACSAHWTVHRMSAVDRNVLRVGVAELMETEADAGLVIAESVEIARRLSGESGAKFVNGVLAAAARALGREPQPADSSGAASEPPSGSASGSSGDSGTGDRSAASTRSDSRFS